MLGGLPGKSQSSEKKKGSGPSLGWKRRKVEEPAGAGRIRKGGKIKTLPQRIGRRRRKTTIGESRVEQKGEKKGGKEGEPGLEKLK